MCADQSPHGILGPPGHPAGLLHSQEGWRRRCENLRLPKVTAFECRELVEHFSEQYVVGLHLGPATHKRRLKVRDV